MRDHEYFFDGNAIPTADTGTYVYDFQYSTIEGCDSLVHLSLYVMYNDGISTQIIPSIEVFPNPAQTSLNIKGENIKQLFIYSTDGQLIYSKEDNSTNLIVLDVSQHAAGQYFLKIILADKQTITRKFIINR